MKTNKGIASIVLALIIFAVIFAVSVAFYVGKKDNVVIKENPIQNQNSLVVERLKKDYSVNDCNVASVYMSPDNTKYLITRDCKATDKEYQDYCQGMNECYGADQIQEQIVVDKNLNQIFSSGRKYILSHNPSNKGVQGFIEVNLLTK